jgi:4-hydroxy-tetrahydrodipicolinate reductase
MNIVLFGYGKMGKEIERLAPERGMNVLAKVTTKAGLPREALEAADVLIHFASPETVLRVANIARDANKNLVIGTTGWEKEAQTIFSLVASAGIGMVWSSNFSLSLAVFKELVKEAARLFNSLPQYDAAVHEVHHKEKADAPSGTALMLARVIIEHLRRKKQILAGTPSGKIKPEQLQVTSARTGAVVGLHSILFDSTADSVTLTHEAKNRTGFALGALLAAEWIKGRQGVFTFDDVITDTFKLNRDS